MLYYSLVNQSSSKTQQYLLFLFHQNDIYLYILNIDAIGGDRLLYYDSLNIYLCINVLVRLK